MKKTAALLAVSGALLAALPVMARAELRTVVPERILDTRSGIGAEDRRVEPGETLRLQHPAAVGRSTTVMNLTAVDAHAAGHVTAWPCDDPQRDTSVLNFEPDRAVPNTAIIRQSPTGICVEVSQPVHLVADLMATIDDHGTLVGVSPQRLVDSRGDRAAGADSIRRITVAGSHGIPGSATIAALNVTAVHPRADGHLTVAPCSAVDREQSPTTSTVNFRAGETVAATTLVALSRGEVCVYASAPTHILVDVFGWSAGTTLQAGEPDRLLDTRSGIWSTGAARHDETITVRVAGRGGVPNGARSTALTVTVIGDSYGHVTVWPCDAPMPEASILNTWPGAVRANLAVVELSEDSGEVCLRPWTVDGEPVHLLADVTGWVDGRIDRSPPTTPAPPAPPPADPAPPAPSGGRFTTLPPGASLPSGAECAEQVRPTPEVRSGNRAFNSTRGTPHASWDGVDGDFVGTTDEILQWAACKWGIDEDLVRAQAAIESWWHQTTGGDHTDDQSRCHPELRSSSGSCPESIGLLQVRYPYHAEAFENANAIRSSAYNADYTYALWRSCYEGRETWLNDFERGSDYRAGDAHGCLGLWFTGRWDTPDARWYIDRLLDYRDRRIWETPEFLNG